MGHGLCDVLRVFEHELGRHSRAVLDQPISLNHVLPRPRGDADLVGRAMIREVGGVDHERISLPPADRMSGGKTFIAVRMRPAVHIDRSLFIEILRSDNDGVFVFIELEIEQIAAAGDQRGRCGTSDTRRFGVLGRKRVVPSLSGCALLGQLELGVKKPVETARIGYEFGAVRSPSARQSRAAGRHCRRTGDRCQSQSALFVDGLHPGIRPAILRGMNSDRDLVTDPERVPCPAPAPHAVGPTHLQRPLHPFAACVGRLHADVDVRIPEGELGDRPFECHDRVHIQAGVAMMGPNGHGR